MGPALLRVLFLTVLITLTLSTAFAQTDNWLGGQGYWESAINWDHGVPVSTSNVVIDGQNQANAVFLESNSAINSLTMNSGNYHLNDLYVDGGQNFSIASLVIINAGRIFLRSGGTMTAGTFGGGGLTISNNSTLKVLGDFFAWTAGWADLVTGGNLSVAGHLVNSSYNFNQESTAGTLTVTGQLANGGSSIQKAGMVLASKVNAGSVLNTTGTIQVQGGNLTVSTILTNTDDFGLIEAGAVASTPMLQNSGTIEIYNGTTLQVGSGTRGSTTGYLQYSNGTLEEEISQGAVLKGTAGKITLYQGGAVFLDGTLNIQLQSGFNPQVGTTYKILDFDPGALSGSFANVLNAYFNNGKEMWQVIYDNADGYVALKAVSAQ